LNPIMDLDRAYTPWQLEYDAISIYLGI